VTNSSTPGDGAPFVPSNWAELAPLLDAALDAPASERADRVRELSKGDAALQRQLEQLLVECEQDMPLLNESAARRFNDLASDEAANYVPEVLGDRYRIGKQLGRGGMSSVYLAQDLKHARDVAVKVIRPELAQSLASERFLREIEIAARLRHPNIVPLFDSGEAGDALFFVMPYEEGQSLRDRLRDGGALPISEAVNVLRDVARALAYAHDRGVVHRDVKPDNVMLSSGAAVVTDFGIAKAIAAASAAADESDGAAPTGTLTQAGTVIGTPAYMAPEQATGDATIDHRADIYSFGCLGYELFAGHPPFQAQATHQLIAAHIATTARPITELRPDVPPAVADLLARCLAKAPGDRPQNARDLSAILDGATNIDVSTARTTHPASGRRSSRARIAAAIATFSAVVVAAAYLATRPASADAPITVSVLPFGNIAGDSTMALIADGLGDEVASALARVPGILIRSRTGARAYRGQLAPDVTEAGARLKADYLVTAVVRQDRGRWILSADLERAIDATSLWDRAFVVDTNEQGAVADSVAGDLTAALRRLFPRAIGIAPVRLPHQQTSSSEAFRLYVAGQEKLARRGQSVKEAVGLFRRAIQEDSLFAPAYSGLSVALALTPWFHPVRPSVLRDELVQAARRALALDSTQALPHVALGMALWEAYDWTGAETEMATAVRLDPRNVEARVQYSRVLVMTGRSTEALTQIRAARAFDPASALVLSHMANAYLLSGQLDSALAEARRAFETDSTNLTTLLVGATIYLAMKRPKEAHALVMRLLPSNPHVGNKLARSGDVAGARQVLQRLDTRPPEWGDETQRAFTYLGLGDTANALAGLERATAAGELWSQDAALTDEMYDSIRHSARFRVLIDRVGLGRFAPLIVGR
jgi:serine/threonine protein kinase/tetratricopeptide (TPR) repeat protein